MSRAQFTIAGLVFGAVLGSRLGLASAQSTDVAATKQDSLDTAPATEDRILDHWLTQGREVAAMRSKVGAARFDVVTAAVWPNPSLTVAGGVLVSGAPTNGTSQIAPQLTFPLPVFGQIGMRKDEATANLRVVEVEVLNEIWDRSSDVEDAMLERAFADAEVNEVEQNLAELDRISRIVAIRAGAGANSVYDTLRVNTTDATFRADLAKTKTERDRSEAKLCCL